MRFQRKILNFMLVGACQNFQFFKETTWFLGNNRDLFKFSHQILRNLSRIIEIEKHSVHKSKF